MSAISGAAFAQSSVTAYGVADLSVAKADGKQTAASANALLNNGNSRFGVKGTEDLGGGLSMSFNFEQAVNMANGATDANTWQRNAFMELGGGFGALRAGRSLSPEFYATAAFEATGTANYSAVANKFGFGNGSRNDANVAYTSPSFGGLKVTVGTTMAGNNSGNSKTQVAATYANGPLTVAAAYGKTENAVKNTLIGGAYDLGMAKVAAGYYDPAGAIKGYSLGVSVPMGAWTFTADMARDTGSATKSTDTVLEAKYALSKRTTVYAVSYNAKGNTAALTAAGTDATKITAANAARPLGTTTGIGIRHNF